MKKEWQYTMAGPTLRIGVSGHQQIGDETTTRFVSQQLREILARYQQQAGEQVQHIGRFRVKFTGMPILPTRLGIDILNRILW